MSPSARLFTLEKRIIGPFQAVIPALFDSLSTTCRGPTPTTATPAQPRATHDRFESARGTRAARQLQRRVRRTLSAP